VVVGSVVPVFMSSVEVPPPPVPLPPTVIVPFMPRVCAIDRAVDLVGAAFESVTFRCRCSRIDGEMSGRPVASTPSACAVVPSLTPLKTYVPVFGERDRVRAELVLGLVMLTVLITPPPRTRSLGEAAVEAELSVPPEPRSHRKRRPRRRRRH